MLSVANKPILLRAVMLNVLALIIPTLYNTIWYYSIWYYTIWYNSIWYNTKWYYMIVHATMRYNTIQYYTMLFNTIQYYTIRYYTIRYYTIRYDTIQYYMILFDWYSDMIDWTKFQTRLLILPEHQWQWKKVFWHWLEPDSKFLIETSGTACFADKARPDRLTNSELERMNLRVSFQSLMAYLHVRFQGTISY